MLGLCRASHQQQPSVGKKKAAEQCRRDPLRGQALSHTEQGHGFHVHWEPPSPSLVSPLQGAVRKRGRVLHPHCPQGHQPCLHWPPAGLPVHLRGIHTCLSNGERSVSGQPVPPHLPPAPSLNGCCWVHFVLFSFLGFLVLGGQTLDLELATQVFMLLN